MKKADLNKVRDRALTELQHLRAREQVAHAHADRLGSGFLDWTYEMLAASAWTVWERFAEEVIIVGLNKDSRALSEVLEVTLPALDLGTARAILLARGYFDFKNSGDLIGRADRYLGQSRNPFRGLRAGQKTMLDELGAIRNVAAHRSQHARRAFQRLLTRAHGYRRTVEAGVFLRGQSGGGTRLAAYLTAVADSISQVVP